MKARILLEPRYGATYDEILTMALATEEVGFEAFFRSDHYLGIDANDPSFAPTDSWTTLGGLARETRRVRLGTLMTAATFRHPGPLAVAVASADAMSGGRVELGLGAGWYQREHESFGIPFPGTKERFDRMEEQLAILTGLWTTPPGERFSFAGTHWSIDQCASFPRPAQRPRPKIIVGGVGKRRTPELAARFADEFNTALGPDDAGVVANFRTICAEVGRDPSEVTLSTVIPTAYGATPEAAEARATRLGEAGARLLAQGVIGGVEPLLERIARAEGLGITTIYFHIYDTEPAHVRELGEALLPRLS